MAENDENTRSGLVELEKTFQEYRSKLERAEQELGGIIGLDWQKAAGIVANTQKKAQQTADEIKQNARREADRIVLEAKNKADKIIKEAEDTAKKEARDRTKREMERIIANARQVAEKESAETVGRARKEADEIVNEIQETTKIEAMKTSARIVAEAEEVSKKMAAVTIARAGETDKLLAGILQKAESIFDLSKKQLQEGLAEFLIAIGKARASLETVNVVDKGNIGITESADNRIAENRPLDGRRELKLIPPYDIMQIKKLSESLRQIPSIRLAGEAGSESGYSIYIDISEPISLLTILREMSLIASSEVRGDTIELSLEPGRNGN